MRKITHYILYILIAFAALLNIQCSGNGKEKTPLPELVHAESVMFDHPDSALHILEDMPMPSARRDKENHALWCLLVTQAQYKRMMKIPSDSLVRIAYDYYKPTDNARRKAMSALYMGDINYELRNIEEAMQYYLEGKTEVEKTDDYKTGYLVMVSLCRLYLYRNFADYALEACRKAYDYAVKDSNKRYQLASLKFMARCYCISDSLSKAIDTYHKCSELTLELELENYYYDIQSEIVLVYKNKGDIEKSLEIIKSFPIKYQPALLTGKNYYLLGQQDSAYIYLNEALKVINGDIHIAAMSGNEAKKRIHENDVVIVGAGLTGCECALSLSKQGKNVTLVDMIDEQSFGSGGAKFNQVALMGLLNDNHVKCIGNVKLVSNNNQLGFEHNGQSMDLAYDHVVLSLGVRPNPEVLSTFEDCANEVIYIGDCNTRIGTLYNAVHTAHEAASVL